jgi:hypothetical protein
VARRTAKGPEGRPPPRRSRAGARPGSRQETVIGRGPGARNSGGGCTAFDRAWAVTVTPATNGAGAPAVASHSAKRRRRRAVWRPSPTPAGDRRRRLHGASRVIGAACRKGLKSPRRALTVSPELAAMGGPCRSSEMLQADRRLQVAVDDKTARLIASHAVGRRKALLTRLRRPNRFSKTGRSGRPRAPASRTSLPLSSSMRRNSPRALRAPPLFRGLMDGRLRAPNGRRPWRLPPSTLALRTSLGRSAFPSLQSWRRRADSNRRWGICSPLP